MKLSVSRDMAVEQPPSDVVDAICDAAFQAGLEAYLKWYKQTGRSVSLERVRLCRFKADNRNVCWVSQ